MRPFESDLLLKIFDGNSASPCGHLPIFQSVLRAIIFNTCWRREWRIDDRTSPALLMVVTEELAAFSSRYKTGVASRGATRCSSLTPPSSKSRDYDVGGGSESSRPLSKLHWRLQRKLPLRISSVLQSLLWWRLFLSQHNDYNRCFPIPQLAKKTATRFKHWFLTFLVSKKRRHFFNAPFLKVSAKQK